MSSPRVPKEESSLENLMTDAARTFIAMMSLMPEDDTQYDIATDDIAIANSLESNTNNIPMTTSFSYTTSLEVTMAFIEAMKSLKDDINFTLAPPPLYLAAESGDLVTVKALLKSKAEVNEELPGKKTALHIATEHGFAEIAQLLIEYGADPHKTTMHGHTPLSLAAYKGDDKMVNMLLTYGADHIAMAKSLENAVKFKHPKIIDLLMNKGADPLFKNKDGLSPFYFLNDETLMTAKKLLTPNQIKEILNQKTEDGWTALHDALTRGNIETALWMIRYDADIHTKDVYGKTPLTIIIEHCDTKLLDNILYNDDEENLLNHIFVLCEAVNLKAKETIKYMLENHLQKTTTKGDTWLEVAVRDKNLDLRELVTKYGDEIAALAKNNPTFQQVRKKYIGQELNKTVSQNRDNLFYHSEPQPPKEKKSLPQPSPKLTK